MICKYLNVWDKTSLKQNADNDKNVQFNIISSFCEDSKSKKVNKSGTTSATIFYSSSKHQHDMLPNFLQWKQGCRNVYDFVIIITFCLVLCEFLHLNMKLSVVTMSLIFHSGDVET